VTNTFGITARAYRWYADGTETGAAALAAESTTLAINNIADYPIVLRYGVQESGAGSASGASTDDYQLQYSLNGGAYTSVSAVSAVVQGFTSANLTDAAATTSRLSAGTGSFVAGEISETDGLLTDWALTANNYSDLLYAIQIMAADTADGDSIDFRVLRNGAIFNTYTVTPNLTIQNAYTLTSDSGAFPFAGTDASLEFNRLLAAGSGSFAFTGTAAGLAKGITLAASSGAFAFTGTAATLTVGHVVTASSGAFAATGTDVNLEYGHVLPASAGSFAFTGTDASLEYGRAVIVSSGPFPFTGNDAALRFSRLVAASSGSFAFGGTTANLEFGRLVSAGSGAFVFTGSDATLTYGSGGSTYTLSAASGSFSFAGASAGFEYDRVIAAGSGSFAMTGSSATLTVTEVAAPEYSSAPGATGITFSRPARIGSFSRPARIPGGFPGLRRRA